jgi:hypothetical protein
MALQAEAIESRLEGLKLEDRRKAFDSQIRAIRMDSNPPQVAGNCNSKATRKAEPEAQLGQVISLLEELSRRIDGLEKKDRGLADEIRKRARQDRRRRSVYYVGGLAVSGLLVVGWVMHWL